MPSIRRSLATTIVALSAAAVQVASEQFTTVAVLEVGKGGAARRTASAPETTVAGVTSLWNSLHGRSEGRRMTSGTPGMSVVADLFNKPSSGVAIGLLGSDLDLASMPTVASLLAEGDETVGSLAISGSRGRALLEKAPSSNLEAMEIPVDVLGAAKADAQVARMVKELKDKAAANGETIVIHLVLEQEADPSMRRRLEDADEDQDNQNNNNNNNNDGFYGYGYYDDNNEWVQVSKTIFQIQYNQVVLWTAIGLVVVLSWTTYLMVDMPLMADTLLFGESAKMMGAE